VIGWLLAVALATPPEAPAAPSLAGVTWVSEGPVASAPLVAVELWATWCGACRATFADLTALQARHGDALRVVALSDESVATVSRFWTSRPEQMVYAVATDPEGEVVRAFLFGGYGGRGIPSTYLIAGGKVVWGGPPEELAAEVARRLEKGEGEEIRPR